MSLHGPVMSWAPHVTIWSFLQDQLSNNVPDAYSSPVSRFKHQSHLLAPPTSSITIEVSLPWKYMEMVGGKEGREGGKGQKHPLLLEP